MQDRERKRLLLLCLAQAALLAACGGDNSTASNGSGSGGSGTNTAPQISGAPASAVTQGQAYSFTPSASDANGDALTFMISNQPPWASFSASTGQLSGTPGSGDVGTYSNIQISVTDGTSTVSLTAFDIQVVGTATGSALLSWTPPTQNSDGSPLTDLAGYKIYWGQQQGNYPNSVTVYNPGISSYFIDQLTPATWFFVATAINSQGFESTFSNVASKVVQ